MSCSTEFARRARVGRKVGVVRWMLAAAWLILAGAAGGADSSPPPPGAADLSNQYVLGPGDRIRVVVFGQ